MEDPFRGTGRTTRAVDACITECNDRPVTVYYVSHNYGHARSLHKETYRRVLHKSLTRDTIEFSNGSELKFITSDVYLSDGSQKFTLKKDDLVMLDHYARDLLWKR